MKQLLQIFLLFSFIINIGALWAVESNTTQSIYDNIDPLQKYRFLPPQNLNKDYIDGEFERQIFEKINKNILQSKKELHSFYHTLELKKENVNRVITSRGGDYYYINPSITTNIYNQIISFDNIRNHFFLDRTISRLLQIEEIFDFSYQTLKLVYEKEDLNKLVYEIHSLLGLLYLYKGVPTSLYKSIDEFYYLLGNNKYNINFITENLNREKLIYEHLISVHSYLLKYYKNVKNKKSDLHKLKRLEFMWKLAKINHKDKPDILNVKQKRMLDPSIFSIELLSESDMYEEFVSKFETIVNTNNNEKINDIQMLQSENFNEVFNATNNSEPVETIKSNQNVVPE